MPLLGPPPGSVCVVIPFRGAHSAYPRLRALNPPGSKDRLIEEPSFALRNSGNMNFPDEPQIQLE
jgi:hypothetical protein